MTLFYDPPTADSRTRTETTFGVSPLVLPAAQDAGNQRVFIVSAIGANFNITTDQAITLPTGTWDITGIEVTNASTSMTTAVGGFYTAASKAGTAVVAATQVYTALTTALIVLACTRAASPKVTTTLYFALTTGQGAAATADIRLYGTRVV